MAFDDDDRFYVVIINHEEQYLIWPERFELPSGWKLARFHDGAFSGTKQEALDRIEEVWTDLPPLSLRKKLEEMEREAQRLERKARG